MLKLFLTSILLLLIKISVSQTLSIAGLPEVLYKDIPVKFNFSGSQIPCNNIHFKIINGKAEQEKCTIWIMPDSIGFCKLLVLNNKGKQIASYYFTVEEKPILKRFIGSKGGGVIKKDFILLVGALITRIESQSNLNIQIKTIKYTLLIIRNNKPISQITNNGARYESKTIELINTLKKDDIVIIHSISALLNETTLQAQPMEFKIDETP